MDKYCGLRVCVCVLRKLATSDVARGQVEARALGRRSWGRTITVFAGI